MENFDEDRKQLNKEFDSFISKMEKKGLFSGDPECIWYEVKAILDENEKELNEEDN
jgi:hypothetical protein